MSFNTPENSLEPKHPLWVYPNPSPVLQDAIVKEFKLPLPLAEVLAGRGFTSIEEIRQYLYGKLADLYDPFSLAEMGKATERIMAALDKNEGILIYGDNDVDGMTGSALLTEFFRKIGARVFFYISRPTTMRSSLIVEALEYALKNRCTLLITVDCGITAATAIEAVAGKGVDVIVTDHHEPTDTLPHCVATLNPKLVGNLYPNRELTGVGVAFKLVHALTTNLIHKEKISRQKIQLKNFLDLVALGTISDMGPLVGENRVLVRYGLAQIRKEKRVGLAKLISLSEADPAEISAFELAAKIAPRLNSLGRISDPEKGVQMLLIKNPEGAAILAEELDLNNIERQKIERTMTEEVEKMLQAEPDILLGKAIVLASNHWHPGVIAILSARIAKQFNRPTLILSCDGGLGKGSLRSIPEFPLLHVLKDNSDLLLNFGGHDFAAGLTIKVENIEKFKKRFVAAATNSLKDYDVSTKIRLDAPLAFHELSFDFLEALKLLEPFGNENPEPIFYTEAMQAWPPKVIGKSHLKMYLEQGDRVLEGIAFHQASASSLLRKKKVPLRIAYTPHVNRYQNKMSIQLLIRDFQIL